MKQHKARRTRLLAWLLCLSMVLAPLPGTAGAAEEYEDITPEGWALNITNWDGWATGYSTAATYSDSDKVLSAAVTKESNYDAANRLISPALDSAVEDVDVIDITIAFEHSAGSSGDVCLQLDAADGDETNTSGGWGKVNGANPQLSSTARTYRFVRQSDKPSSLKKLMLYFYVGDSWNGEFTGTAKISSIKAYKTKAAPSGEKGELTLDTGKYEFTSANFGAAGWPQQNAPVLNAAGEIELTGTSLTTGDGGWGNFSDYGLHVIEWPKAANSGLDLNNYDQASLTVSYPAGAQNTDKAKLAVEINTGKKANTQLVELASSAGSVTLNFTLAAIEDQSEPPLTIRVLANGGGTNTDTALFDSGYTIKLSGIQFSKSTPPASNFTITAKTTIPNVADEDVWFKAFEPTAVTNGAQTISLAVNAGDGGAFHADSAKALKEDGTDVSTAVSLSFDQANDKVTLNTENVDYNIILVVNYGWISDPTPGNTNTIKSVFVGNGERQDYENLEAMAPYKADYTPGDKKEFKVAAVLWGGFPLDKITASASDGTDLTDRLTIVDGEAGFKKVTVDTTGLTGPMELLATYSTKWNSGGGGGGGGGGGSKPTLTQTPGGGKGAGSSVTAAGTVVSTVRGETKGGVLTMEVSSQDVEKLISQNKDRLTDMNLITFQPKYTTRGSASALVLPAEGLSSISEKTAAGLRAEGPVADVTLSRAGVRQLAGQGGPVTVSDRRDGQNTYSVSLLSGEQVLKDIPMYVELHGTCGFGTRVCLVKDNGETEVLPWAMADRSGRTMRFRLPASGTVRLETDEQITFKDVPQESWAAGPVAFVSGHGIFSGYEDGSFRPNLTMNRAMLVQILYRFAGSPDSGTAAHFTDVPSSAWCFQAVGWAAEQGIAGGYGNGQFGAARTVNRQDAVCFLYRYMGSPAADESILDDYIDKDSVGPHARRAIAWALENGVLIGETNETIAPTAEVTRYQAAKLMADLVQSQAVWNGKEA